jgi:hypothetical protein
MPRAVCEFDSWSQSAPRLRFRFLEYFFDLCHALPVLEDCASSSWPKSVATEESSRVGCRQLGNVLTILVGTVQDLRPHGEASKGRNTGLACVSCQQGASRIRLWRSTDCCNRESKTTEYADAEACCSSVERIRLPEMAGCIYGLAAFILLDPK